MKKIIVEWYQYEKDGNTCCRCGDSTEVVRRVVDEFKVRNTDLDVELKESSLEEDRMDILGEKKRVLTVCPSCSELIGEETDCNSYVYKGKIYDSLPDEMFMEALHGGAHGNKPETPPKE